MASANPKFFNTAVLTSKNPEVFLNFSFDGTTGEEIWVIPSSSANEGYLYVNGLDIANYEHSIGYALHLDASDYLAPFHVYTPLKEPFSIPLFFKTYGDATLGLLLETRSVSIKNRPFIVEPAAVNEYNNEDLLIDDEASYMLIRTNPKFTGNIVLNIDISNNIYMDTFKISDTLSNKLYRKQKVSANSVLSSDIRNVFSSMPRGELYRVDVDNTLEIATPKTELKDQYNVTYNYGARLLRDELYNEDNGMLAPLWINSKLPDYFALFRMPGVFNQESYDASSLENLAFKYLEQGSLIRSWSLRPEAPLGKYLATHMADVTKFQAPVFLSLTDPDIAIAESDPNTWYGIAVDKGVVTGRSETPYFFNQKASNFTDLNAFMSEGFERNNLLCPNLINLQYVFSDNDVSLYSMHRYFGFYLTENILYTIAYYSDSSSGPIEIISLDGKDSSVFINSSLFDSSGNIISSFSNRIFVLNDEIQLKRISNINEINGSVWNQYVSKPDKNLFSANVQKQNINQFITLTLNNTLEQGEHLRLINLSQNKIWEIYSVDTTQFPCERYCTISENPGYPTVYRTFFDINGDISYQIQQIESAFDLFSDYEGTEFRSGVRGNNWVSLIIEDSANSDEWQFQRIAAPTLNDFSDPSSGFNTAASPEDIAFFGRFIPTMDDFGVIEASAYFGPIDFELYGDRQTIIVNLINRGINNLYSFDASQNIVDKFEQPTLYQGTDGWYRRILDFDVSNNSYQYVKDPLSLSDKILIMSEKEIQTIKGIFNAYSIYPLNLSLMGINPVKDVDYTVYDSCIGFQSEYIYNRENDISTWYICIDASLDYNLSIPGSYVVASGTGSYKQGIFTYPYSSGTRFNTFDTSLYFIAATNTRLTYAVVDGSYNYTGYKSGFNEENLGDYYDSSALLKYGLTIPSVAKWVGLGTDCRDNPFRLLLDASALDTSTNFIPTADSFNQEISYPVYKYLTPCGRAWQDYVFYDINDVLDDNGEYFTFRELMFKYPYVDYFSKLLYSNYNVEGTKTRSSIVYYNGYKNTIDVIFLGLNLSIQVENIAKNVFDIKNYDRYRFSFISTPSRNRDHKRPIDVIINENTKTILMVWYQGNDELNYNVRYSTYLPGKSIMDSSGGGFISGGVDASVYSFVKTPFYVNNSTIQKTLHNFYGTSTFYSNTLARPYAQLNLNQNGFNSEWNAFGNNTISVLGVFNTDSREFNTFLQRVEYTYLPDPNTFGDHVINYGYNYGNNRNWYTNNTTKYQSLQYFLSPTYNYVMYSVIRGDEVYTSEDFGLSNPFRITINPPRTYRGIYTYNGWFKPKFNSILDFQADEEVELINTVDRDFVFSNTNLRKYNNISQLWYHEVVSTVTSQDVSAGNAIGFVQDFNVFKALWDSDYYIKDNIPVDGYESTEELPAFFGSKLPKLPDQITLENWDITTAQVSYENATEITLLFNLTRAVRNLFKSNIEFLGNWAGLSNADSVIDSYINNTILTYYNISTQKITVGFFYKPFVNQSLAYNYDSDFLTFEKQNFNGQVIYQNDEYLYKIVVPKTGNYTYFVNFTLTEK